MKPAAELHLPDDPPGATQRLFVFGQPRAEIAQAILKRSSDAGKTGQIDNYVRLITNGIYPSIGGRLRNHKSVIRLTAGAAESTPAAAKKNDVNATIHTNS